jgi:hypothetical protein
LRKLHIESIDGLLRYARIGELLRLQGLLLSGVYLCLALKNAAVMPPEKP